MILPQQPLVKSNLTPLKTDQIISIDKIDENNNKLEHMSDSFFLDESTDSTPSILYHSNYQTESPKTVESHSSLSSIGTISDQHFRTKLCPFLFGIPGECSRGEDCSYAHSLQVLRSRPDLTKTKLCDAYMKGRCYDYSCKWAHGRHELKFTGDFYKTSLCKYWIESVCYAGMSCRHAHGEAELRKRKMCGEEYSKDLFVANDPISGTSLLTCGSLEDSVVSLCAAMSKRSLTNLKECDISTCQLSSIPNWQFTMNGISQTLPNKNKTLSQYEYSTSTTQDADGISNDSVCLTQQTFLSNESINSCQSDTTVMFPSQYNVSTSNLTDVSADYKHTYHPISSYNRDLSNLHSDNDVCLFKSIDQRNYPLMSDQLLYGTDSMYTNKTKAYPHTILSTNCSQFSQSKEKINPFYVNEAGRHEHINPCESGYPYYLHDISQNYRRHPSSSSLYSYDVNHYLQSNLIPLSQELQESIQSPSNKTTVSHDLNNIDSFNELFNCENPQNVILSDIDTDATVNQLIAQLKQHLNEMSQQLTDMTISEKTDTTPLPELSTTSCPILWRHCSLSETPLLYGLATQEQQLKDDRATTSLDIMTDTYKTLLDPCVLSDTPTQVVE